MSDTAEQENLEKLKELISTAEAALSQAKMMFGGVSGIPTPTNVDPTSYVSKAGGLGATPEGRVIEGVFDGQNMLDNKGSVYPVPANYASKSKLIPGDVLKLTITDEGKFLYKQIGPVERKPVVGPLVHADGKYQVLANDKAYNVLLASVTYFRAAVGDEVTLIIPANEDSDWGAIEAVLPKFDGDKGDSALDIETELDI